MSSSSSYSGSPKSKKDHKKKKNKISKSEKKRLKKKLKKKQKKAKKDKKKLAQEEQEERQFQNDAREMYKKMSAAIGFDNTFDYASTESQKIKKIVDDIHSNNHKLIKGSRSTDPLKALQDSDFHTTIQERAKQLCNQMTQNCENPEELTGSQIPLSFRERLQQKHSELAQSFLKSVIQTNQPAPQIDKKRTPHLNTSSLEAQIKSEQKRMEEKLKEKEKLPLGKRDEIRRVKLMKEQERIDSQMKKIRTARLKRKRMNEYKMKQKEAMRNRKSLEQVDLEYNERGRRIEEQYLKALQDKEREKEGGKIKKLFSDDEDEENEGEGGNEDEDEGYQSSSNEEESIIEGN